MLLKFRFLDGIYRILIMFLTAYFWNIFMYTICYYYIGSFPAQRDGLRLRLVINKKEKKLTIKELFLKKTVQSVYNIFAKVI